MHSQRSTLIFGQPVLEFIQQGHLSTSRPSCHAVGGAFASTTTARLKTALLVDSSAAQRWKYGRKTSAQPTDGMRNSTRCLQILIFIRSTGGPRFPRKFLFGGATLCLIRAGVELSEIENDSGQICRSIENNVRVSGACKQALMFSHTG